MREDLEKILKIIKYAPKKVQVKVLTKAFRNLGLWPIIHKIAEGEYRDNLNKFLGYFRPTIKKRDGEWGPTVYDVSSLREGDFDGEWLEQDLVVKITLPADLVLEVDLDPRGFYMYHADTNREYAFRWNKYDSFQDYIFNHLDCKDPDIIFEWLEHHSYRVNK